MPKDIENRLSVKGWAGGPLNEAENGFWEKTGFSGFTAGMRQRLKKLSESLKIFKLYLSLQN